MDVVELSRLQFALTILFHYLFPPLTIGLSGVLVVLQFLHLKTRKPIYLVAAKFWTRLFALSFALGVATGIVMEFQFGTNWAHYSRFVGDVFGSALAAEGIFAFFLESGFLAVLLFGWNRVSPRVHFFATLMVALGSIFSAVWIIIANSWQQTPAGYQIVGEGLSRKAEITDFWAMVFNPSSMVRLAHTLVGAYVLGAFFVLSISAWYILRGRHLEFARRSFNVGLWVAAVFTLLAGLTGDSAARIVAKYQPVKLAAMEGHFPSSGPAGLHLFGIPDEKEDTVHHSVAIPGGLSFLLHGDFTHAVPGLESFPREDWPPVSIPFASFHWMVTVAAGLIGLTFLGLFFRWRGKLFNRRWFLWLFVPSVLFAYSANMAGWITAEVGRQPWTVYGLLRTSDSVSKSVTSGQVLSSIVMFGVLYSLLFCVWVFLMNDKIKRGPEPVPEVAGAGKGPLADVAAAREGRHKAMMDEAGEP